MKDKIALGHRGALRSRGAVGKRRRAHWGPLCHPQRAGLLLGSPSPFQSLLGFPSSVAWRDHHGEASDAEMVVLEMVVLLYVLVGRRVFATRFSAWQRGRTGDVEVPTPRQEGKAVLSHHSPGRFVCIPTSSCPKGCSCPWDGSPHLYCIFCPLLLVFLCPWAPGLGGSCHSPGFV